MPQLHRGGRRWHQRDFKAFDGVPIIREAEGIEGDTKEVAIGRNQESGDAADLLVPFMFVLWKYTVAPSEPQPCELGIRITSGPNAGDTRVTVGPGGMDYAPGDVSDVTVIEFDPGSFVLTAFGRSNAGSIRGDREVADRYLNLFFRI